MQPTLEMSNQHQVPAVNGQRCMSRNLDESIQKRVCVTIHAKWPQQAQGWQLGSYIMCVCVNTAQKY